MSPKRPAAGGESRERVSFLIEVNFMLNDEKYMRMALSLARKGCGLAAPNPMVGAVIVKEGRVIGRGISSEIRRPHAEQNALSSCTEPPQGSDVCDFGAVLPFRETAALREGHFEGWNQPCGGRFSRSKPLLSEGRGSVSCGNTVSA